jgi:hypothetical protein
MHHHPNNILHRGEKVLKTYMEAQKNLNSQSHPEPKHPEDTILDFKLYY